MVYLTRKLTFSAAHRLFNPAWSEEENKRIYGKCFNPSGHGHNYTLHITLRGEIPSDTGMLYELKQLKQLVREHLLQYVDHRHLNKDVPFLKDIIPTAENLVVAFWKRLEPFFPPGVLYELTLYETENNWVSYRGE